MAIKTNFETNGYKYYKTTKTIGHKVDGTPIKKVFYGKSKSEAEEKANEYIELSKKGITKLENRTLDYLFHDWLWNVKRYSKNFKSSSFDRYERVYRNEIKDSQIAACLINEVTPLALQRYYNKLYKNGIKSTKIKDINKVLGVFFQYCKKQGWINSIPTTKDVIDLPGDADTKIILPEDEDIKIFSDVDREKIINIASEEISTLHVIILLALATGMRKGEILGLQPSCIDLKNKEVKIRKTLERINIYDDSGKQSGSKLVLVDPKSKSSVRNIPLPDFIIPILKNYPSGNSVFFESLENNFIDPRNLSRAWERFLQRNNINYLKFHALRHTYASLLFRKGANIKEVQKLLGHSELRTTEKIYISVTKDDIKNSVNNINDFFI